MILGGFEIPLWAALSAPTALFLYIYLTRTFSTFKDSGIPGPTPWPLVGTTMALYGDSIMSADVKVSKKYGKFVGTFEGSTPVLMVFDGEWLKEAFIKHFSVFTNRRPFKFGGSMDESLFSIGGEHWKSARKMLSPEFSSGKLKEMMPAIQKCDDVFVRILTDSKGQPVDIRRQTNLLTLDVISQTAFGVDSEVQTKMENQYTKNAFLIVDGFEANSTMFEKIKMGLNVFVLLTMPEWMQMILRDYFEFGLIDRDAITYFEQLCDQVIKARAKETPGNDFLQSMIGNTVEAPKNHPDTLVDDHGNTWTRKGMTEKEVVGNAILFLMAGFQTTADTAFFLFYELAKHPEIQQKLYEEIIGVCDTEEVSMEQINQLKYLDCCINEVMRLYPQGFRFDRMAAEDITIRDIQVKKGTAVTASGWVIHRDPEIWENPEDFEPERFSPERLTPQCSASFMPFGIGNRQCIGSRLALIAMKMTMISALKVFTIEENEQTPKRPLKFKPTIAMAPEQTIMVSFMPRS